MDRSNVEMKRIHPPRHKRLISHSENEENKLLMRNEVLQAIESWAVLASYKLT